MAKTNSVRSRDWSFYVWLVANVLAPVIIFDLLMWYSELVGLAFYLQVLGAVIAIVWIIISMGIIYYRLGRNNSIRRRDRSFYLWLMANFSVSHIFFDVLFSYSYLVGLFFYLGTLVAVIGIVWIIISMGIIYYRLGRNPPQSQQKD